jgi:hypothetical protein
VYYIPKNWSKSAVVLYHVLCHNDPKKKKLKKMVGLEFEHSKNEKKLIQIDKVKVLLRY